MRKQPTLKVKTTKSKMDKSFRLFDFNVYSADKTEEESSDDDNHEAEDMAFDDEYGDGYQYSQSQAVSKNSKIQKFS